MATTHKLTRTSKKLLQGAAEHGYIIALSHNKYQQYLVDNGYMVRRWWWQGQVWTLEELNNLPPYDTTIQVAPVLVLTDKGKAYLVSNKRPPKRH